ncbi:phytanoyl-CoA dioxygenase domain-containing protein 1-like [Liolophura sinensis]|uniref:phytanoyl-CoA dioxygenase domain-containing protein 1-like n=1 Tax=Liolophura sinensis TaxID=3198878 RepID=UPI003159518E
MEITNPKQDSKVWPGESNEAFPEVFCHVPPPPKTKKPGQLSQEQIKQFVQDGYLIIDDYFDKSELEPVKDWIDDLVDDLAEQLFKAGKIKDLYKDFGTFKRLTRIDQDYPGANIVLLKRAQQVPKSLQSLWANERLLNLAEQILGPEVWGNPVWNLRPKVPRDEVTTVPWHQDAAYMDNESYSQFVLSAWIPFLDATEENGCLKFVKGGHRSGKVAKHQCCHGDTFYVRLEKDEMERKLGVDMARDVVAAPVKYGGFVLFNNIVPHGSTVNFSSDIRWSVDLRWQKPGSSFGLWGLKKGVEMRSSTNPSVHIDWDTFNEIDRTTLQEQYVNAIMEDEFDTTLHGPWMKQWEIVHHNRHTAAVRDDPAFWQLRG